jgi:hypothetical protein
VQELRVIVDPKLGRNISGVVAFGDFEVGEGACYPLDGLPAFFEDLARGRAFPTILAVRGLTPSLLVAMALFVHRELALQPGMLSLVTSCGFVDRLGLAGMAHIDRDLARFFKFLLAYLPFDLSQKERQERLEAAVEWVRQYVLRGALPALPPEPSPPRVIDTGTKGFVLAEGVALEDGWVELFRQGYLWGVLLTAPREDRRRVLAARKSHLMPFDPRRAAEVFNEAERAMGAPEGWRAEDLWLWGPDGGTLLLPSHIVDVVIRIQPG